MITNISTDKLKSGMFIDLSDSFLENPFWKDKFLLKSDKEIKKIIKAGIKRINIDTNKCSVNIDDLLELEPIEDGNAEIRPDEKVEPPGVWAPEKYLPAEVVEAVKDKNVSPETRSKAVHDYSLKMMQNIMDCPTAENIGATKESISQIVDIIMDEDETCNNLTKIISHDYYTYTHSVNVGVKSILLAKKFYTDPDLHNLHELGSGFFLHDIGKVNIDTNIINKRGKLTVDEYTEIKKHPMESEKILRNTKHLSDISKAIVTQHHEREDGSGYPFGLKGYDIHPYAIICCLADVYDALTAQRSYNKAKPPEEALQIMAKQMSNHYNKDLLDKFLSIFEEAGIKVANAEE